MIHAIGSAEEQMNLKGTNRRGCDCGVSEKIRNLFGIGRETSDLHFSKASGHLQPHFLKAEERRKANTMACRVQ